MNPLQPATHAEALAAIPESPSTIEFRAAALDPRATIYHSGDGLLLVNSNERLVCAAGEVDADDVDALYQQRDLRCELVADAPAHERLRDRFAFERAIIQTLSRRWQPAVAVDGLTIRLLEPNDVLDHLPEELHQEIDNALALVPVFAGFVDGVAVSFAYACPVEKLFDVAIDTVAEHRNRGIGAAVVSEMIDHYIAQGKHPVWGALESSKPSLRLAEKLGFCSLAPPLYLVDSPRDAAGASE